jgi:hypothetical protein
MRHVIDLVNQSGQPPPVTVGNYCDAVRHLSNAKSKDVPFKAQLTKRRAGVLVSPQAMQTILNLMQDRNSAAHPESNTRAALFLELAVQEQREDAALPATAPMDKRPTRVALQLLLEAVFFKREEAAAKLVKEAKRLGQPRFTFSPWQSVWLKDAFGLCDL